MVSKSFKTSGITLAPDRNEDEMFIDHSPLVEDEQFMIKQVDQSEDE